MKTIIQESQAREILNPYVSIVRRIFMESLNDLNMILMVSPIPLNKRNKSGLIHNFSVARSRQYFGEFAEQIELIEKYSSIQVIFKDKVSPIVARFKKVNSKNLSSNSTSVRSNAILNQLSLFPFEVTYVEFGYRLNQTETEFEMIGVICRAGDEILWNFEIAAEEVTLSKPITKNEEEANFTLKEQELLKLKVNDKGKS